MAQIIKHRRGRIDNLKGTLARNGELVIASGSISDLHGPFIFIGSPIGVDDGVAGAFNTVSKLYTGTNAPSISAGTYGSGLDGTPFYTSGDKSLYILNNSNVGNIKLNLVGNIEGGTVSGLTINSLTSTTATITNQVNISGSMNITGSFYLNGSEYTSNSSGTSGSSGSSGDSIFALTGSVWETNLNVKFNQSVTSSIFTGSFKGDGAGLYNIPATGVTGLELNKIVSGSVSASITNGQMLVNGDVVIAGTLTAKEINITLVSSSVLYQSGSTKFGDTQDDRHEFTGSLKITGSIITTGSIEIVGGGDLIINGTSYTAATSGTSGSSGTAGTSGSSGTAGSSGTSGSSGSSGSSGTAGTSGSSGTAGTSGSSGSSGTAGTSGSSGTAGTSGSSGSDGTSGTSGSSGSNGSSGTSGTSGSSGTSGTSGSSGSNGSSGTSGTSGSNGSSGTSGSSGSNGSSGTSGTSGSNGSSGSSGSSGSNGSSGTAGTSGTSVSVTGTNNYIGKFNSTGATITLVDSSVIDNGTDVTVNSKLIITGTTNIQGNTSVTGAFTVGSGSATMLGGDLFVSGNLQVLGSSTSVSLQSNTVAIGDNIILVNAYSPFQRYAGISGYDSGSANQSGSLLWDSLNNKWLTVDGSNNSSKVIGTTPDLLGFEVSLTNGTFPLATGDNSIGNSLLTYSGSTLQLNTDKFTVNSSSGNTVIAGTLKVSGNGADAGTNTSTVTFKNSTDVFGEVSATSSSVAVTSMLGYKTSDGTLTFTDTIDGGTF